MFSANDVKTLREKTGAGMLDCKKALQESNGNMDAAVDWLREKGIAKAAKKEGRIAAEGITKIVSNDEAAVIIEVNSETDFVAKNAEFLGTVEKIAEAILNSNATTMEEANAIVINGETVADIMVNLTARIGEKLSFRRFARVQKNAGDVIGTYSHMGGRIGVIIALNGGTEEVARDVAMHTAAMRPSYISRDMVDADVLAHESEVIKKQAMEEGKPADIAEKMVAGRINKFYKEICLNEQPFVKDPDMNVETFVKNNGGSIASMIRFEVGEGIEKKQEDFASEVMSQING